MISRTIKIYTREQLKGFGLDDLKAIADKHDCSPLKYRNRKSSWIEAVLAKQNELDVRQESELTQLTLLDTNLYNNTNYQGVAPHIVDIVDTVVDSSWNNSIEGEKSNPDDEKETVAEIIDPVPAAKISTAPISRAEAALALGVPEDRIVKDPIPTLNCCVVVFVDDEGKRRSKFVSYRRFTFWIERLQEAIATSSSPEEFQVCQERVYYELTRFWQHYPKAIANSLRFALSTRKLIFSEKEAIAL